MPRVCTVCSHPERKAIDDSIVSGDANTRIAASRGLKEQAVRNHGAKHLPAKVTKAAEAREQKEGESTLNRLIQIQDRALAIATAAEGRGSFVAAVTALGEIRQCLALTARLTGELNERPQTNVLVTSPDWLAVQAKLMDALRPYPAAMEAVRLALSGEAKAITG